MRYLRPADAEAARFRDAVGRRQNIKPDEPVLMDPDSGLMMLSRREIIVCLRAGIRPQSYFGSDWPNVRRLKGTSDQYILARPKLTVSELFAELSSHAMDKRVKWAQPSFVAEAILTVNDPYYPDQWALNNTGQGGATSNADANVQEAWAFTTGKTDIVIAVLDSGVETAHPDLYANIYSNAGEIAGNAYDDDNNGYTNDVNGWDFYYGVNDPTPKVALDNHGTCVAGVAAACGGNATGTAGVAYGARIMPVRVLEEGDGYALLNTPDLVEAIYYCAGFAADGSNRWRGADIVNMSFVTSYDNALSNALTRAASEGRGGKGTVLMASSGNYASGWMYASMDLPVPLTSLRISYEKDALDSAGDDTVWMDNIVLPNGDICRFETTTLSTPPWSTGGDLPWEIVQDGVNGEHAMTGWDGPNSKAIRPGTIGDNQTSWIMVTTNTPAGSIAAWIWMSCGAGDRIALYLNGSPSPITNFWGLASYSNYVRFPASHPSVLAIGSSTDFDYRSDYSCYGPELEFVAPSDGGICGIVTTDRPGTAGYNEDASPSGDYNHDFGGTSAACPFSAGVAALVLSVNSNLTAGEVASVMHLSCSQVGAVAYSNGWNEAYGHGRIDALAAVTNSARWIRIVDLSSPAIGSWSGISFYTVEGRTYSVSTTTDLNAGPWVESQYALSEGGPLTSTPITGSGGIKTVFLDTSSGPGYYGIAIEP